LPDIYENDDFIKKDKKKFENMEEYNDWKDFKIQELKAQIFNKLTPMEYYITQGKGTERPFTGDYWDLNTVGVYCCKVCTQRIFSSTHKYHPAGLGHAAFWNFFTIYIKF